MLTHSRILSKGIIVLLVVTWAPATSAPAQTDGIEGLLARPVSPGTIALLVSYPASASFLARLETALKDSRPDVRATAARVIFVTGARGLAPAVIDALRTEQDVSAAMEEARVVARFADADGVIVDAWLRLGAEVGAPVLYALAGARGSAALQAFTQAKTDGNPFVLRSLVRIGTSGERGAILALATEAIRSGDRALFAAALSSARDGYGEQAFLEELAGMGLQSTTPQALRVEAVWHTLSIWRPGRRLPKSLEAGLERARDGGIAATDPAGVLALGLVARATGRQPSNKTAWLETLAQPPIEIRHLYRLISVRTLLTEAELETLGRAAFGNATTLQRPTREETRNFDQRLDARPPSSLLRVASGYPRGLVADVFAVTQCDLGEAGKSGLGEAFLTLRPDGRVMKGSVSDMALPPSCATALRTLMATYVVDIDRAALTQEEHVLTPFEAEFIACQDSYAPPAPFNSSGAGIEAPKKTRHINPEYSPSAQNDRVQGTVLIEAVISPTGCVARADVTRSVDLRLDWAALRAVLGWQFTPTLLNGTPVATSMTVTVTFSLD